jgi:hypothetical protein
MLSDQLWQLLSAYVDGELTNRQRRAVQRLLRRSAEARALLRQLQEDAARLRALPRPHLGGEFTARVVRAVRQRQEQGRRREVARQASFPVWAGFAAAAAVLLAVSLGSFFYFARPAHDGAAGDPLARADNPPRDSNPDPAPPPGANQDTAVAATPPGPPVKENDPPGPEKLDMPVVSGDKPKDPAAPADVITQETPLPGMEIFLPHVVKPPFALIEDVREIKADKLRKDFGEETALRVELPCADTARGFRRLQAALKDALKDAGITLAIDPAAQNRLDKPRLRSNYVIFVEDVTAEELAQVLARVGRDDKKAAEAKPKPDGQFSKMVANRLADSDLKELSAVLHVEARQLQSAPEKAGKGAERLALAVTYNPERPKANSPEVKRYLESRKPARPGALQVLLVLREAPR